MNSTESFVFIYELGDGQYYISAVELSDMAVKSMSCAHNPSDHTNLVTWYNVDDKGVAIVPSMWNFVEYADNDILYTIVDEAGNVYSGTYSGDAGKDLPLFSGAYGHELINEKWNGNSYEATIKFPFMVSKVGEMPNEILISNFAEKSKLWHAVGNDVKVQTNNAEYPIDINCLWAIYPLFDNGCFRFVIKNISNGKYVYSDVADNTNRHNKQGTVVLSDKPSEFEYVQNGGKEGFRFADKQNLYLSIYSVNDNNVYMGVYPNPHTGTNIYVSAPTSYGVYIGEVGYATFYAEVPVIVPEGVAVYYLARDGVNDGWVQLTEITEKEIPAGVGVVLKVERPGVYYFDIKDTVSTVVDGLFKGSVAAEYVVEEAYVLYASEDKAELCKAEMNQTVGENQKKAFLNNGHEVYLPVSNLDQNVNLSASLRIYISGVTAVNEVETAKECVGGMYDLTGRKVESLSIPGVYIVNGKKKIVR